MFPALGNDDALRSGLLTHNGGKLAQQQLARRHCFGQTQRQQLCQRRLLLSTFRRGAGESFQLVFNMLKAVGVRVNIETVPSDDFFEKYINTGNFDFTVFSWIGTPFPISSSKSIYAEPKGDDIQQNYARTGSAEIDGLFDQANSEFDDQKRIDLGNQVDAKIWELVHSMTLYQRPEIIAAKTKLANFGAFGFATIRYENIGFKK